MKNIYRWGLMRNSRQENLSEHSLETALIAHLLAVIRNRRFGGNIDPCFVATAAMFHDTSEIITGDMPTPVKYRNPEIKNAYKEIEASAQQKLLSMLPEDIRGDFVPLYTPDEETEKLIKAADKLSALIKCIEETVSGNREFSAAEKATRQAVKALNVPEAEVFLEEFIPSFYLTLDEQK